MYHYICNLKPVSSKSTHNKAEIYAHTIVLKMYTSIKLCKLDSFGNFKTLCDFKLCDCIVRKILLTINFVQLKFVHNLIMRSGSDSYKTHK